MKDSLWTGQDIVRAAKARVIGIMPDVMSGISIDSRTIRPRELYVAIKGDVHDGHSFAIAALEKGAAGALISESWAGQLGEKGPFFVVPDALDGLIGIAHAARLRSRAKIIAVTGSAGKTGTKDALALVLSQQGQTHHSVASFNNHWGVPLTLARFPAHADYGVFEIGMNHAGEITPLVGMVKPHIAIITTIAPVHLEYFGTTAAIADAKGEIFSGVMPGGSAIINGDIAEQDRLDMHARNSGILDIIHFGASKICDARLIDAVHHDDHSDVKADILGSILSYKIASPGRHIVKNSLAVLAACARAGADVVQAADALRHVKPPQGRGARMRLSLPKGSIELIDESYNANPASMAAALDNLGRITPRGRRIAVLGDMLELGAEAGKMHAALLGVISKNSIDVVFLAGPLMQQLWEKIPSSQRGAYAETSQELLQQFRATIQDGDVITVKGSLGSRMGLIVKALTQEFPVIADANG